MSVPTPTDVSYGCVAGRIVDIIGDSSSDVGDEPDAIPVSGTITFQPDLKTRKVVSPYKAIAQNRSISCTLDPATGIMKDAEAREYVKLVAGTYTVSFTLASGTIAPFVIEVTTAHTEAAPLQLSEAVPYVPPPGSTVQVVQVPPGGADGKTLIWDDGAFAWADPIVGPPGPANVLTIGTVTQGTAAASIAGTSPAQVLNLTLPKGDPGDPGAPGSPTAYELRGTGMPEGVVTAAVGTYYTDSSGTNGAWRWLKVSGAGNTGWQVAVGDTGWRNVTTLLTVAPTAGAAYVRRVGPDVEYIFSSITGSASFLPEPTGFVNLGPGAGSRREGWILASSAGGLTGVGTVFINRFAGNRIEVSPHASTAGSVRCRWATTQAWPTTLPGTAA